MGRKIIIILRILTTSKRKWILYLIPKSVLSPEKNMMGIISLPPPLSKYEVKIHCWEYDYLNLLSLLIHWIKNHFLNIGFHKLFHTYFYCLNLCWTNVFFDLVRLAIDVTVLKALCFWCPSYKVMGNQGFISYGTNNLLVIAIKTVL